MIAYSIQGRHDLVWILLVITEKVIGGLKKLINSVYFEDGRPVDEWCKCQACREGLEGLEGGENRKKAAIYQ